MIGCSLKLSPRTKFICVLYCNLKIFIKWPPKLLNRFYSVALPDVQSSGKMWTLMLFPGWRFFLSQKKPASQVSQVLTELIKSPSSVPGPGGRNRSIKITLTLGLAQRP